MNALKCFPHFSPNALRYEEKEIEDEEKSSWSADHEKRGYYYDDAHGYEVYKPDEDEKEEAD